MVWLLNCIFLWFLIANYCFLLPHQKGIINLGTDKTKGTKHMENHLKKVKEYLLDLGYLITHEDAEDQVLVVSREEDGIRNLVIGIADPIVIFEQFIFDVRHEDGIFKSLLQKNRDIIHGAFVLDESGSKVIFRDTLQLENLDANEVEGTLNSLSLLMSEYSDELIAFAKN